MKGFASNLISRHIHTEANIVPRLRGRFESEQNAFHEDVNPAPVNHADTFSERINAEDNKGPDADTETSTYRPVIANTAKRQRSKQPDSQPEPEIPAQVNFSAARAAFTRPAAVTPAAADIKPRNAHFDNAERGVPNEPDIRDKQQTATLNQHDFNANLSSNPVKSNESGIVWSKAERVEERDQPPMFTGKKTGKTVSENSDNSSKLSTVQVNEPVQPATNFKSLNTGMQNSINAVSPPNISNGNMREGGQRSFQQTAQPVIKVTIGRIEVKAVHPQAPVPAQRREPQKPILSLDDFLSQHKQNG